VRLFDDLLLFVERVGWKQLVFSLVLGAVLVGGGAVYVLIRPAGGKQGATTSVTSTDSSTYVFYLRAMAPRVVVHGCNMRIRFHWKPDYHADQYVGSTALITFTGAGLDGTTKMRLTKKGLTVDAGPLSLAGGYKVWAAKVTSVDGDPPANDTTIQAAPPTSSTKCR
jgi:hypothetical protein